MKILSGDIYKNWHQIYVKSSNEKDLVYKTLKNMLISMPTRKSFLDIGPGDGALTLLIKPFFDTTTVIEPNNHVADIFTSCGMEFINQSFEDCAIHPRKFDFILCSHVFWLIKKEAQPAFINKMYSCLEKHGKMAIIMMAPIGQCHELHTRYFYNYDTNSHEILKMLRQIGLPVTIFPLDVKFQTASFNDFLSICKLFTLQSWLHPVNISDEKINKDIGDVKGYTETKVREISDYINAFCLKRNNTYAMEMAIDVLVVAKC
jgi:ubiquinone/menaquinone biosynthesis C-methylase UbiE